MSLEITEMFDGIKNGSIELQQFHDWLCQPYTALTDEEILYEGRGCALEDDCERLDFARAILRKAQEK